MLLIRRNIRVVPILLCLTIMLLVTAVANVLAKVELRVTHAWPAERLPAQVEFDKWFMKEHPDIVIRRENIPWADYKQKIMVQAAAGTLPDVFYMQDSWSLFWIYYGMARNLESFLQKDEEYKRELFYPGSLVPYIWKGDLHGIPYDWNGYGTLAYNVDMFDKAGLSYPDKSWTFEGKFLETAKKLTKDDQWGWVSPWGLGGYIIWESHFLPFGGAFVNEEQTECLMTKPESIKALQWWADLIKHKVSPTLAQQQAMVSPWYSGKIGMTWSYGWCYEWTKYTPFKWDVADTPMGPNGRFTAAGGSGYVISKTTKNVDAAWTYFREYLSLNGVKRMLLTFGLPARKAGWEPFAGRPDLPKNYRILRESLEEYSVVASVLVPPEAWQVFGEETELVLLGKKTAEEAAKTIKAKVDPILAKSPLAQVK